MNTPSLPIDPTTFAWRLQQRPTNFVPGYEHGAHARAYLRQWAEQIGLRIERPQRDEATLSVMRRAGYSSWDKFARHLLAWHELSRPIPRGYADYIGVARDLLLIAFGEDCQDHQRALATAPILHGWTLRWMAGVYEVRPFPADCQSELDCTAFVAEVCIRRGLRANIHIRGVKTLWLEPPSGHVHLTVYEPRVKITRTQIIFADDGRNQGTMRLA